VPAAFDRTGPRRLIDLARQPLPAAPPLDNATEPVAFTELALAV